MPATFSSSSQFSFADSVRSAPQYLSSSFRIHPAFISRAVLLFLDFLRAIIFSPSRLPSPFSRFLLQHLRAPRRASDLTLSSYVSSILYLSSRRPRALLTVRRTLESHKALRRIFHAAISASRDKRRYSSRRPKKNAEISFQRGRTKFPWPLIKRILMQSGE